MQMYWCRWLKTSVYIDTRNTIYKIICRSQIIQIYITEFSFSRHNLTLLYEYYQYTLLLWSQYLKGYHNTTTQCTIKKKKILACSLILLYNTAPCS